MTSHLRKLNGPSSHPPTRYRADIDGLRAIAVLAVVVYHLKVDWLPGGFCGVDVFFVISGFVVTRSVFDHQFEGLVGFTQWFYARRFRRILPAVVVCVLTTSLVVILLLPRGEAYRATATATAALLAVSNIYMLWSAYDYFAMDAELSPFTHTWSLGVEEQFYLVFPALLVLLYRPRKTQVLQINGCSRWWWRIFLVGLLSSIAISIGAQRIGGGWAFYLMPARFWELGLGVALAIWEERRRGHDERPLAARSIVVLNVTIAVIVGAAILGFAMPFQQSLFPFPAALPSVVATAGAIWVGTRVPSFILSRILGAKVLIIIGKASYSLYLWHWPTFALFRWTVGLNSGWDRLAALVITAILSALSYRFIEQTGRRWAAGSGRTILYGLAGIGVGACLIVLVMRPLQSTLYLGTRDTKGDWDWLDRDITLGDGVWRPDACAIRGDHEVGKIVRPELCTFRGIHPEQHTRPRQTRLLVLGNSFAEAGIPMLRGLLEPAVGLAITAVVGWSCSPGVSLSPAAGWERSCEYYAKQVVPALLAQLGEGDIVLMLYETSSFTDEGPRADGDVLAREAVDRQATYQGLPTTPRERRKILAEELSNLAARMRDKGVAVVFQATTPLTRGTNPRRCETQWFRPEATAKALCPRLSRARNLSMREAVMGTLTSVRLTHPNFYIFDPFDELCSGEVCNWFEEGRPVWRDDCHIAGWKAEALGSHLRSFLESKGFLK